MIHPPAIARLVLPFTFLPPLLAAPASAFDGEQAAVHVQIIADDDFAGRMSGFESGRRVEGYVANLFAEWGLVPAGQGGTYFHEFDLLRTDERDASLSLVGTPFGTVDFLYGDDFTVVTNSGSGDLEADVVLVGRGLSCPDREWDDYEGVDVKGKIALIVRGLPENGYDWGEAGSRDSTLHEAVRRGAVGVLFLPEGRALQGAAVHEGSYFPDVPVLLVEERVFLHVLMDTGWDAKRYRDELKKKPTPLVTGKRLQLRTDVLRVPGAKARNVAGMLEGSDPALKDEIVVIGAHMDHVGVNGNGIVYNGADDNASGTSVVMELARSFAQDPARPARTIVFATFGAEEQGLLGSEAFVANPCLDLSRVVAMVNFDMTGHGNGKAGLGGGEYYPEVRAALTAALDSARADSLVLGRAWRGDVSDHAPFRKAGIPVMNLWSEGDHRFYHTLQDDPQWIDTAVLASVGRMAETWIRTLADWRSPLLGEHRAGRSLLYAADQVDFDASLGERAPSWVRGSVHWFPAKEFAGEGYVGALAGLKRRAKAKELALVRALKDVHTASAQGKPVVLVGLRAGGGSGAIPADRAGLLAGLEAGMTTWPAPDGGAAAPDLADAGLIFLAAPDTAALAALPASAKRCVRFWPGRGEQVASPESVPRKSTLFVVSLDAPMPPLELWLILEALGPDRVHLDLVPWLAKADEPTIAAYLEDLQSSGSGTFARMVSLLGGNLARL